MNIEFPFSLEYDEDNEDNEDDIISNNYIDYNDIINNDYIEDSDDDDIINYNYRNIISNKCQYCNKYEKITPIKIEINITLYLCNECKNKYIINQFYNKMKYINKYILFISIRERPKYTIQKYIYMRKLYNYIKNNDKNNFVFINEMNDLLHDIRNNIIFHPGYPQISTFISLLKTV